MAILTFNRAQVKKLVDHTKKYPTPRKSYLDKNPLGLYLVGDHGIYLMSNSTKTQGKANNRTIAYAKECDPTNDNYDWYDNKVSLWGGDDGAEVMPLEMFNTVDWSKTSPLKIKLTQTTLELIS